MVSNMYKLKQEESEIFRPYSIFVSGDLKLIWRGVNIPVNKTV